METGRIVLVLCCSFLCYVSSEAQTTVSAVRSCHRFDVFDCGGGHCIAMESVCDGNADCPDGEDEPRGQCGVDECLVNNGNCSQTCADTVTGFHCACEEGYILDSDGRTCDDFNECEYPQYCSQICHNENGTYRCECEEGYVTDPIDSRRCEATVTNVSILLVTQENIRKIALYKRDRTVLVNVTGFTSGLDFVYSTGVLFWSRKGSNKIHKAKLNAGNDSMEIISENDGSITGLAVDWLYNHIYWTVRGEEKSSLWVANLDGSMRKSLIDEGLDTPAAMAVNPLEGWLFWSDCGDAARIERAGLDGTHRRIIVSGDIERPTGLTLDFVQRRIYWADNTLHVIASCEYDGSGRKLILTDQYYIFQPVSIFLFDHHVYWTNSFDGTIRRTTKITGIDNTIFLPVANHVEDPKVYHPNAQPEGVNHCGADNGNCSHLCLPAPQVDQHSPRITCACPERLFFRESGGSKCDIIML